MADRSVIEWTDATWNPVTGCDRVSPGCDNCYALTLAGRLKAMGSPAYQEDGDPRTSGPGFAVQLHPDRLAQPLRWTRPRRVFVNSMSDLFHPQVPDEFVARVFAVMAAAERHVFQVLTKRPKRMRALLGSDRFAAQVGMRWRDLQPTSMDGHRWHGWPLPNVWLGVSVEDQQRADERIPVLRDTPAAVRWLSCEPLLGPVDLSLVLGVERMDILEGEENPYGLEMFAWFQGQVGGGIGWVVVGGESGPGARPMHPAWARTLRDQATAAGAPFFFKQWGAWSPAADVYDEMFDVVDLLGRHVVALEVSGHIAQECHADGSGHGNHQPGPGSWWMERVGKHDAGRVLDGRTWDEFPETVGAT